ncbi:MAG: 30S ribosomal protein S20 [Candidatus Dadabacteria bacterium]|nr:30S ribosomal protein S20 [Candidatus Dadabacteria bacterium]NIT14031.1 30S ribosomal protein S20 [Candidatus Dadabacteria bacterium]
MALRIKSGIKKNRQSIVRRERNTHVKSALRTAVKTLLSAIESKDLDKSKELLKSTAKAFDKAATKGVIHKRTASRNISKFSKKVHGIEAQAG